ncbi:hypothetical protein GLOTRDRAFT_140886 [Gloeophyllum trabeum ATCC 11539]|uniref:Chromo domain-containing protein n=1 Tax=Gloeophyllum trabeum (strain ATCC 11539 / FP-39264 / Madison 617) TaxID=670483 RepID=S7RB00_GLOTA|nr:uncharacterized protein GLOTRDRAFT_140886 [Gloeophyllum trabeum ATCC 11539]EPQ51425.1 hypothetical protein GLOTRDRAFT_140886 [Gloeophyllum trabeum ATCC 11539]
MSDGEEGPTTQISDFETQFEPQEGDSDALWEVIEITGEKKKKYRVKWAGTNPKTGKAWPQSWVDKHDCTDDLVEDWKLKKARKKREEEEEEEKKKKRRNGNANGKQVNGRSSTISRASKRGSTVSTTTKRIARSSHTGSLPLEDHPVSRDGKRARTASRSPTKNSKNRAQDDDSDDYEAPRPRKKRRVHDDKDSAGEEPPSKKKSNIKAVPKHEDEEHWMTDYSNEPTKTAPRKSKAKEKAQPVVSVDIPVSTKVGPPRGAKKQLPQKTKVLPSNSVSLPFDIPAVEKVGPPRGVKKKSAERTKIVPSKPVPSTQRAEHASNDLSQTQSDDGHPNPSTPKKRALPASFTTMEKGKAKAKDIDRIALREEEEEESQIINQADLPQTPRKSSPPRAGPSRLVPPGIDLAPIEDDLAYDFEQQDPLDFLDNEDAAEPPHWKPPSSKGPRESLVLVPETQPTPNKLAGSTSAKVIQQSPVRSRMKASRVYGHGLPVSATTSPRASKKTPGTRPLRPIPAMTPSHFKPFLSQDDAEETIDQFSSPEKGRSSEAISSQRTVELRKSLFISQELSGNPTRKRRLSDIIASSSRRVPEALPEVDQTALLEEMENAYVDYSSGVVANADSPDLADDGSMLETHDLGAKKDEGNGPGVSPAPEEVPPTLSTNGPSSAFNSQEVPPDRDLREQLENAVELLNKKSREITRLESELVAAKREAESLKKEESQKIEAAKRQLTEEHADLLERWRSEADEKDRETRQKEEAWRKREAEWEAMAEKEAKWADAKRDLESQRDLFREQYGKASDFASSMQTENNELQARVQVLESQLEAGLNAVRSTYQVRIDKLQAELHKYDTRVRFLEETQKRMLSSEVTKKAAEWEERGVETEKLLAKCRVLERENDQLSSDAALYKRETELLQEKMANMAAELTAASAETQEKAAEEEWDEDEDGDWVPDNTDGSESEGSEEEENDQEDNGDVQEELQENETNVSASDEDLVYMCKWAVDGVAQRCNALVTTQEELRQHFASAGHWGTVSG